MGARLQRELAGVGRGPGTYVLVLRLREAERITVGRLGTFPFPAGYFVYVGSACGPGGLAGRLRHHLAGEARPQRGREACGHDVAPRRPQRGREACRQGAALRRPHWHIDYLRHAAAVEAVWLGAAGREHDWAALLRKQAGASIPVPRFGASDCTCPAHLLHLPGPPDLAAFNRRLQERFPGDPPVRLWTCQEPQKKESLTMNRLYLVRHGENPANITREFSYKRVDHSLTPKGVLQARQTAEYFADKGIDEVYSSPLKRATETADIIAARLGLQAVVMENWREVNVGELEDRPPTDENWEVFFKVARAWFGGHHDVAFPGGEDYHTLWARTRDGLEQLTRGRSGRNIVVVGHGGIFTFTLKDLCPDVDLKWLSSARTNNCAVSELLVELREGRLHGELVAWAQYNHLHGEAAEFAW